VYKIISHKRVCRVLVCVLVCVCALVRVCGVYCLRVACCEFSSTMRDKIVSHNEYVGVFYVLGCVFVCV
jgi:hypothetical protein